MFHASLELAFHTTVSIFPTTGGLNQRFPSVPYDFINAYAHVLENDYYGTSFQIYDLTTAEAAPMGTTNAADAALVWTPQTGGLPTVTMRIILPAAEAGKDFVLHATAGPAQAESAQTIPAAPAVINEVSYAAVVEGQAGLGHSFWLERKDDRVVSPIFAVTQGNLLNWSDKTWFPADYVPAWASTQFRIGGTWAGHSFSVRHPNGIRVPFSVPASGWTGHLSTPNSAGQPGMALK